MKLIVGDNDESRTYWTIIGDIAVALFLVFVLLLVVQYMRSVETILVNEALERRQNDVAHALYEALNIDSKDPKVRIEKVAPDRQRVRFSSEVLFRTCRTRLLPEGNDILLRTGQVLRELGSEEGIFESISIDGHTDVRPTGGENCPYTSNWELSTMRATAVVRLLENEANIPGPTLSAAGRAAHQPIARGHDLQSLRENRRIEVTIQYDRDEIMQQLKQETQAENAVRNQSS